MDSNKKMELLKELVDELCDERGIGAPASSDASELWQDFRALVNTRPPSSASNAWLSMQDELLKGMIDEAGVTQADDCKASPGMPQIRLWQGDITTLAADAIVNAANNKLLGCWVPGHFCIDNAIHTFAGVQLRLECARIMEAQGHDEPTGTAKITKAYNLPAKHVIHTVGPIANGAPTAEHRQQLAACYRSCLDLAEENMLESIAFCCISTGVFGFPQGEAAQIAVETVRQWLEEHDSNMTVVFNVFGSKDLMIYQQLLGL